MGFWDIIKPKTSAQKPRIRSKKDLVLFLKNTIGDEGVSSLMVDVLDQIGRDGFIEIKQGGKGNPYEVEYRETTQFNNISTKDILARLKELKEKLTHTDSELESERLQKKIAELAGGIAVIHINVDSQEEFDKRNQLLKQAYRSSKEQFL